MSLHDVYQELDRAEAELDAASRRFEQAEWNLEKIQDLLASAQHEYDLAGNELHNAEQAVQQARAGVEDAETEDAETEDAYAYLHRG